MTGDTRNSVAEADTTDTTSPCDALRVLERPCSRKARFAWSGFEWQQIPLCATHARIFFCGSVRVRRAIPEPVCLGNGTPFCGEPVLGHGLTCQQPFGHRGHHCRELPGRRT